MSQKTKKERAVAGGGGVRDPQLGQMLTGEKPQPGKQDGWAALTEMGLKIHPPESQVGSVGTCLS